MDPKAPKVMARFAAAVLPFKPKPKVPTTTIRGDKYVLSTFGGMLGDREDDEASMFGGRLIGPPPGANKWCYLWVYDTERQVVAMWRASDGDEKYHGSPRSATSYIVMLDKRGQLNRVTNAEFRVIESEMRQREDAAIKSMQQTLEEAKSEAERSLDDYIRTFFEKFVLPKLLRGLSDVKSGATPIGFRPFGPAAEGDAAWLLRQKSSYVLGEVFKREMDPEKVVMWLEGQGFNVGIVHNQAIDWAIGDVRDEAAERYLPKAPYV
jgi:hypothetical protein